MRKLYESLGNAEYDNLIYDLFPPAVPFTVTIRKEASAASVLKRGTVLALSGGTAGDGKNMCGASFPIRPASSRNGKISLS